MTKDRYSSDEDLMIAYSEGHEAAFEALYLKHKGNVFSYLRKRLHNQTDVNEVFQLIFLKLHQSRELYSREYLFTQWLFTISRSVLIDFYRKNKTKSSIEDKDTSTTKDFEHFEDKQHYSTFMARELNPLQNDVVKMKVFDESSYEEIAEKLNLTQENVRQVLSRSLKKLKSSFGKGEL